MPSVAIREIENDTGHLISTILMMRAFAYTKTACDNAKTIEARPTGRMADLVTELEFAVVREEIDAAKERSE